MILFPAIDLKNGQCVRLKKGVMDAATVFGDDPAMQAERFESQGFEYLHVVDLNGAFAGKNVNDVAVKSIIASVNIPVQLGGGIRSLGQIEAWLDHGISRVILGTAALREPELVTEACKEFPGRIVVGIDARDGKVAVEGWAKTSGHNVLDLAEKFEGAGVAAIIFTDIDRDGVLTGVNWQATLALAQTVSIPVIASGGLASMDDIDMLCKPEMRILEGVVSGRALYDGRIDPDQALKKLASLS